MAATRTIRDVRVEAAGQKFTGSYEVHDKLVEVWSAWGSRTGAVKGGDPKATAEKLLASIISGRA